MSTSISLSTPYMPGKLETLKFDSTMASNTICLRKMKQEATLSLTQFRRKHGYAFQHLYVQEHACVQKTYSRKEEIMRNIEKMWIVKLHNSSYK